MMEAESDSLIPAEAHAGRREQLRLSALRLLQRREYSRRELERKLSRRKAAGADAAWEPAAPCKDTLVSEVLDGLRDAGLQSDARFAASLLRSRAERGYGPRWIRAELQQRGVSDALIEAAFAETDVDWQGLLRDLVQRRFSARPPKSPAEFQKRKRFLLNRGFAPEMVQRACRTDMMTD